MRFEADSRVRPERALTRLWLALRWMIHDQLMQLIGTVATGGLCAPDAFSSAISCAHMCIMSFTICNGLAYMISF